MTNTTTAPEELAPSEKGSVPALEALEKDALSGVDRLISHEDLIHPGTQKLVLSRLDKAESEVKRLEPYRDLCGTTKTELAVAQEQLKSARESQSLRGLLTTLGGLLLGLVPSVQAITWLPGLLLAIAAAMLLLGLIRWSSVAEVLKSIRPSAK